MRIAIQRGHWQSAKWGPGAPYEDVTLGMIVPHIVNALKRAGQTTDLFGGDISYNQHYDAAAFIHCDSDGNSSGFSIGFWEEMHPGSQALASALRGAYSLVSGLKFIGWNITIGEHHYNANSKFITPCRCALIECGFVSNPSERAFLQSNAEKLGNGIAQGVLNYFGEVTMAEERWSNRADGIEPRKQFGGHFYIGKNEGQKTTEDAYLAITNFNNAKPVKVTLLVNNGKAQKSDSFNVPSVGTVEKDLRGYNLTGAVFVEGVSDKPLYWTIDRRGYQ